MSTLAHTLPRMRHRETATTSAAPRWARAGFWLILALVAALCLWQLTISGNSNTYYASAVKSASVSWKAWFFGSLDPGSFITVDKPPLSIWLMGLSARVLGFSSFSMLLPQALCTIGSVAVLHATVRRLWGAPAALAAAAALAITPVTVAIARVNNPDALLVLLLVAAGYLLVRAIESGRTRTLAGCGALVGLAFMTKMLQGWMVVPAFGATYLLAAAPPLLTRVRQLAVAAAAMVAVSAAWPLAVTLWPGSKPYIGGSTDGSVWDLILGYNGLGRITGGGTGQGASFGGLPGWLRLFNDQVGGQIAWLLPLAGAGLLAGLWLTRRAPRTDRVRAGWVLFGLWALVHVAVFSTQKGTFHPYYTSALAPAVAALAGGGAVTLLGWARRSALGVAALIASVVATALTATTLLGRTPDFAPALTPLILGAAGVAAVAALLMLRGGPTARRAAAVAAVATALAVGAGPASYAVETASHALNGNNVLAGPTTAGGMGGMGGGMSGSGSRPAMGTAPQGGSSSTPPSGSGGGAGAGGGTLSTETINYLLAHQGSAKYLVAATGSQTTASIILSTGKPVVTIGGFSGSDPAPTVSQLAAMVTSGQLKYVLVGSSGGGLGGGQGSSAITAWVKAHGKAVSGVTTASGTLYAVSA